MHTLRTRVAISAVQNNFESLRDKKIDFSNIFRRPKPCDFRELKLQSGITLICLWLSLGVKSSDKVRFFENLKFNGTKWY